MKLSTIIVAGGAGLAGLLLWRAFHGAGAPSSSRCAPEPELATNPIRRIIAGRKPALNCAGLGLATRDVTPVQPAPPVVAPVPTKPAGTTTTTKPTTTTSTTTRLSTTSYIGRISL